MHRKVINRKKIDWEQASCRGLEVDLFYAARSELVDEGLNYNHLRRMCFACPLQVQCLEVGTAFERYGFWGGLSEDERRHIYAGRFDTQIIRWLRRDLALLNRRISEFIPTVLSVERDFTFNK